MPSKYLLVNDIKVSVRCPDCAAQLRRLQTEFYIQAFYECTSEHRYKFVDGTSRVQRRCAAAEIKKNRTAVTHGRRAKLRKARLTRIPPFCPVCHTNELTVSRHDDLNPMLQSTIAAYACGYNIRVISDQPNFEILKKCTQATPK